MLEELDQRLFLVINGFNSPFWDKIMWAFSDRLIWVPLYLAIVGYLAWKFKKKIWIIALFLGLSVALADQISVQVFKNVFCRLRPCHEPLLEGLVHIVNGKCGGQYGFVSSHAANAFNVAVISILFIRKRWYSISIVIWALIIGYSRIYLGVHYPGDVICGSFLGILVGFSVYKLYEWSDNRFFGRKNN